MSASISLRTALAAALIATPVPALAAADNTNWPNYREGDFVIADYRFTSGETLAELKLHYRTLGTAERNAAGEIVNGVLLLQGNTGTGANWLRPSLADELFKPGQPFGCRPLFHHYPGRARPRRIEQAFRRAQGQVPALRLSRHG
jgi:homoserine O-acetyltransferase